LNAKVSSGAQLEAVDTLWREVLGLADADPDRSFADLGGTSLSANQLVARLKSQLDLDVPVIAVFEHPTLRQFRAWLSGERDPSRQATAPAQSGSWQDAVQSAGGGRDDARELRDVAIIGMACRFPGARNLDEYWQNLLDGKDTITELADEQLSPDVSAEMRSDPRYVKAAGLIDEPYAMDAAFFEINPMEAKLVDPQHRALLELSWHALEHAGQSPATRGARTGVWAGVEDNSYYRAEIQPYPEAEARSGRFSVMTGNEKDYVAMRIAHKLDLRGPAVSVHTACSTSLVAVIMAAKALRAGDCDLALAGGASVHFPTPEGYYFQEGGVFSSDGHCRPFDADAEGTNFTDGAGMVVLKRLGDALRDHDTIYAVIRGGAINNDGGDKIAFSAPSISGQSACISEAIRDAGVDPATIQYVEAHGTATPVGDPIELEGLRRAFGHCDGKLQFCGLGSVKSNIGHTTAAAGVASLIKMALALKEGVIPASLHYRRPNPRLELQRSPFYIVDRKTEWPTGRGPHRAGVSSFGIGGTNSHLVLEEAPQALAVPAATPRPFEILPVSSRSAAQRDRLLQLAGTGAAPLRDQAYTLQSGRARLKVRGARVRLTAVAGDDLLVQPAGPALADPRLVFMFPGQGSQYIQMGLGLYHHLPEFRAHFDECCTLLARELEFDFKAFIFDAANQETLEDTRYTQPALFAIGVSLGRTLLGWGIVPAMMIGHSIGEFAAAHLAGVFSLEDGIRLIAARGRLMASLPRGRMLSVRGPIDKVLAAAGEDIDVASINSPVHCVLAGENALVDRVVPRLEAAGFPCKALHTSHAFHSRMMTPVVEPFLEVVRSVRLSPPRLPIFSTVKAAPLEAGDATNPLYWAEHLRATVRFSPALLECLKAGGNLFLEVGPRATLATLATQHFAKDAAKETGKAAAQPAGIALLSDQPDAASELGAFGSALARLWAGGYELPWQAIWGPGRHVAVPALQPFQRREFRYSEGRPAHRPQALAEVLPFPPPAGAQLPAMQLALAQLQATTPGAPAPAAPARQTGELLLEQLGALFSEFSGLSVGQLDASFVEAGFDSLVLMQIGVELGKKYGVSVSLRELMGRLNTLRALAGHIQASAPAGKLPRPVAAVAAAPAVAQALVAGGLAPGAAAAAGALPAGAGGHELVQLVYRQLLQLQQVNELLLMQVRVLAGATALPGATAPVANPPGAPLAVPQDGDGTGQIQPPARKLIRARHVAPATQ
jgi:acyl transferase domain-containing protein